MASSGTASLGELGCAIRSQRAVGPVALARCVAWYENVPGFVWFIIMMFSSENLTIGIWFFIIYVYIIYYIYNIYLYIYCLYLIIGA